MPEEGKQKLQVDKTYNIEVTKSGLVNLRDGAKELIDWISRPQTWMNNFARASLKFIDEKILKGTIKGSEEATYAITDTAGAGSFAIAGGVRTNVLYCSAVELVAGSFAQKRDWFAEFYPETLSKNHRLFEDALGIPENSLKPNKEVFPQYEKGGKAKFQKSTTEYFDQKYQNLDGYKVKPVIEMRERYYLGQELKKLVKSGVIDKEKYKEATQLLFDGKSKISFMQKSFREVCSSFMKDNSFKITGLAFSTEGGIMMCAHTNQAELVKGAILLLTGLQMTCVGVNNKIKSPYEIEEENGKLYLQPKDGNGERKELKLTGKDKELIKESLQALLSKTAEDLTHGKYIGGSFNMVNALNIYDSVWTGATKGIHQEFVGKSLAELCFSFGSVLRVTAAENTNQRNAPNQMSK